jgi:hypothetical protein
MVTRLLKGQESVETTDFENQQIYLRENGAFNCRIENYSQHPISPSRFILGSEWMDDSRKGGLQNELQSWIDEDVNIPSPIHYDRQCFPNYQNSINSNISAKVSNIPEEVYFQNRPVSSSGCESFTSGITNNTHSR